MYSSAKRVKKWTNIKFLQNYTVLTICKFIRTIRHIRRFRSIYTKTIEAV